jgi:histidine triad (HIT) family protein
MLTDEQAKEIKKQIFAQIENWPEDKKDIAKKHVEKLNNEELEKFIQENNMSQTENQNDGQTQCIFCLIAKETIKSVKLAENKKALAVLEINPISKGHSIVIPKEHSEDEITDSEIISLINKVSDLIMKKLSPKKIEIFQSVLMGHKTYNILPIYNNETKDSERKKALESQLKEIKETLFKEEKPEEILKKLEKAPVRIP